jgi:hypothetical protein
MASASIRKMAADKGSCEKLVGCERLFKDFQVHNAAGSWHSERLGQFGYESYGFGWLTSPVFMHNFVLFGR